MKQDIMTRNFYRRNSRKDNAGVRKIIEDRKALLPGLPEKSKGPIRSEIEASIQILIDRGEIQEGEITID